MSDVPMWAAGDRICGVVYRDPDERDRLATCMHRDGDCRDHEPRPDDVVLSDGAAEPSRSDRSLWHADEAEKLVRLVSSWRGEQTGMALEYLSVASVHATLAHAAAVRENTGVQRQHLEWLRGEHG